MIVDRLLVEVRRMVSNVPRFQSARPLEIPGENHQRQMRMVSGGPKNPA